MEGFNYVSCGVAPPGSLPQAGNQSFSMKGHPPPFADFKGELTNQPAGLTVPSHLEHCISLQQGRMLCSLGFTYHKN
eukprot:1158704-Pelagomonas_calceolata.AAC.2